MSTQGVGNFAINAFWESGRLIYYEKAYGHTTTGNVFILGADYVQVGDTANDVNFQWKGDTTGTFTLDAGAHTLALTGMATSTDGAVTITNATATSSTTTGALIVTGGIATAADITCGDDLFMSNGGVINFNAGNVTLTHATNALTFATSRATAAMDDGYGMFEIDATVTGIGTGHAAASSSWLNIPSGTAAAGSYQCARNDGVYEAVGATITNAKIIFGARMQKILGDTDALSFPWSINTSNAGITALIDCSGTTTADLSVVTNAGSDTGTLVPFARDVNATKYIKLYDLA